MDGTCTLACLDNSVVGNYLSFFHWQLDIHPPKRFFSTSFLALRLYNYLGCFLFVVFWVVVHRFWVVQV